MHTEQRKEIECETHAKIFKMLKDEEGGWTATTSDAPIVEWYRRRKDEAWDAAIDGALKAIDTMPPPNTQHIAIWRAGVNQARAQIVQLKR